MKTLNASLLFAFASLILASGTAHADAGGQREPMRIDFNQMIEKNAQQNQELQRGVLEAAAQDSDAPNSRVPTAADRRNVIDFIDMEVGVVSDRAVVDRR